MQIKVLCLLLVVLAVAVAVGIHSIMVALRAPLPFTVSVEYRGQVRKYPPEPTEGRPEGSDLQVEKEQPCGFWEIFINHNEGPGVHKWTHYFPIYEEHFGHFCRGRENLTMGEIGIHSGGSLLMWRQAFGEKLQLLVGMDINPDTKAWERFGPNVKVEIGSQGDPQFLQSVKRKYPEGFDILLDDGSHIPDHQFTTFVHMWEMIRPGGVLLIEDVHGVNPLLHWLLHGHSHENASMPGWYYPNDKETGKATEVPTDDGNRLNRAPMMAFTSLSVQREVESIKVYPFVIAITRRKVPLVDVQAIQHGSQWMPY